MYKKDQKLSRGLKPRHVQLIALGGTIGTGLFLGAGQTIKTTGPAIIIAYLLAGIACFLMMRALGELLIANHGSKSYIELIRKYLGNDIGYVAGWMYWLCWITIAMTEITASGLYVKFWFPNFPQWLTGLIVLIILFCLNSLNVSAFGETEFWFALIKIVAIITLIITGVCLVIIHYKTPVGFASISNLFNNGILPYGIHGFALSLPMVVFSFVGIEIIGMTATETKNPQKQIPKCINNVPIRILIFYVGSLLALMCIYPWIHISASSSPFVQVFSNIGIKYTASIINFVVLTAALSSCNSAIFSTGRIIFSLSSHKNSKFDNHLAKLSKHHVPSVSISFSTGVISLAVILNLIIPNGIFSFIASASTICFIFIWSLIILAHLSYRKSNKIKKQSTSTFKMPFAPYSDYIVLTFFLVVLITLTLKLKTLIALILAIIWMTTLFIGVFIHNKEHQYQND